MNKLPDIKMYKEPEKEIYLPNDLGKGRFGFRVSVKRENLHEVYNIYNNREKSNIFIEKRTFKGKDYSSIPYLTELFEKNTISDFINDIFLKDLLSNLDINLSNEEIIDNIDFFRTTSRLIEKVFKMKYYDKTTSLMEIIHYLDGDGIELFLENNDLTLDVLLNAIKNNYNIKTSYLSVFYIDRSSFCVKEYLDYCDNQKLDKVYKDNVYINLYNLFFKEQLSVDVFVKDILSKII